MQTESTLRALGEHAAVRELPDAPQPQPTADAELPEQKPGKAQQKAQQRELTPGFPPVSPAAPPVRPGTPRAHPSIPADPLACQPNVSSGKPARISCAPPADLFQRFVDSSYPHPLTPRQKGMLAFRNVVDPFNFGTIAVVSGVSTAADPHSPYGPGFPGFGRNFGVAYTETIVGEFFGTFLIPSITHQDPHYHRMPNASVQRRIVHCITEVGWTQSDYGTGMPNYATLFTTAIGDALGNLYVPGREVGWGAAAARWSTAIATDPIDNFVTEFVPDVARRLNLRIVLIQRVINEVAKQNGGGSS